MLSVIIPQTKVTYNEKIVWLNKLLNRIEKHNTHKKNMLANGDMTKAQYRHYTTTKYNPRKETVLERIKTERQNKRDAIAGLADYEPDQDSVNLNNCFEDIE